MEDHIKAYNDGDLMFEGKVKDFLVEQEDEGYLEDKINNRQSDVIEEKGTLNGDWKFIITEEKIKWMKLKF